MTQEKFAEYLGIKQRTVAAWHERPDAIVRPEFQRALDAVYEHAPDTAKIRFARYLRADDRATAQNARGVTLKVAIAVVVNTSDVLLVRRQDNDPSGITWQFPAGIVKPGTAAKTVAVRETLAETGIHCVIHKRLGDRIHPLSGVNCEYFLCEYLAGTVENRDASENIDAIWVPKRDVSRFIPADSIFPPIMKALEST